MPLQCLDLALLVHRQHDSTLGRSLGCLVVRVSGASLGSRMVVVALWSGGRRGQSGDLVPGGESGGHLMSVLGYGESVSPGSEVGRYAAEGGEEPLGAAG